MTENSFGSGGGFAAGSGSGGGISASGGFAGGSSSSSSSGGGGFAGGADSANGDLLGQPGENLLMRFIHALSSRERALLIACVIAAIVAAAVFFLVIPAMEEHKALNAEIDTLAAQKHELDQQIARSSGYQAAIEQADSDFNAYKGYFHAAMTPEELDTLITGLLTDSGLKPTQLSMSQLLAEDLPAYVPEAITVVPAGSTASTDSAASSGTSSGSDSATDSDSAASSAGAADAALAAGDADTGTTGTTGNTGNTDTTVVAAGSTGACVYTVDVDVSCTEEQLLDFLDRLNQEQAIEVSSYSFTLDSQGAGSARIQIKVYCYL
ncbi:MAG: type II secretion system protein M [Coriobacteriales bacterium]|jgi:type II secretory pathway component PulM|nr:type II secretion system protein M [Coriobacteriales bacterium]